MKRDFDLCRRILLAVETHADATLENVPEFDGVAEDVVTHHVKLLVEGGLLDALDASSNDGDCWIALEVTWAGHDFLAAARDDATWSKAKRSIGEKIASVPFDLLNAVLFGLAKKKLEALGLPL